jgi:hypothetical protein
VRDRETKTLSDTVTRTTTRGEAKASATAGINKDKDGDRQAHGSAKASATAFADNIAYDNGKGVKASAGYEVGTADANAKRTAARTADGVTIRECWSESHSRRRSRAGRSTRLYLETPRRAGPRQDERQPERRHWPGRPAGPTKPFKSAELAWMPTSKRRRPKAAGAACGRVRSTGSATTCSTSGRPCTPSPTRLPEYALRAG